MSIELAFLFMGIFIGCFMHQYISIHCKRCHVRAVRGISKNHYFSSRAGRTQNISRRNLYTGL